ncbi:telomere length regulation protein TEL2 homolog [Lethenteron reissneri]|uniref:telomere length regulation protein TEL2 homolog n=1 Tax=Lethenteron reissneri TaxID=7753 RepID=UPI002AB7CC87|nr:telomere length regulation protein TEL2 homolog [Lethenteron reissneri]XP_061404103.1 telomere length regulation protein TEL2 homolog [Lethenteron reissneri]
MEAGDALDVRQALATLAAAGDGGEARSSLELLTSFLHTSSSRRDQFEELYYARFVEVLLGQLSADWLSALRFEQQRSLVDAALLCGPPDQALLALLAALAGLEASSRLDKCVSLLETFLRQGRLAELMFRSCVEQPGSLCESSVTQEILLGKMVALPDLAANKLKLSNREMFRPVRYFELLATETFAALERVCAALRDGRDCSLKFISAVLGKACTQGHAETVWGSLMPRLTSLVEMDFLWRRIGYRLLENVPDRWSESVMLGLVRLAPRHTVLSWLLGDLVLKNPKLRYLLTQKMLLLRYDKTHILRNILGYLADEASRRALLIEALKTLLDTWSNASSVKHTSYEQHAYITQAILICLGLLNEQDKKKHKHTLLSLMMGGVKCHLESNIVSVRRLGMITAESITSVLEPAGHQLKFEYEEDEETVHLKSLLNPEPEQNEAKMHSHAAIVEKISQDQYGKDQHNPEMKGSKEDKSWTEKKPAVEDEDLDSDDDLVPYDMSDDDDDDDMPKLKKPHYIRDCMEGLLASEKPDKLEAALMAAESLIRGDATSTKEVSVELVKILLHLEELCSIKNFQSLRQRAMVAATATDPARVASYLTAEFYGPNYNLRQRMDMLDTLVLTAQELSQVTLAAVKAARPAHVSEITEGGPTLPDPSLPTHWTEIVRRRIDSKTKRFASPRAPEPTAAPNNFAAVAGNFFFPLIRNYDNKLDTFDLLGEDHMVLARLLHTLGAIMHAASCAPLAPRMAKTLLDFLWALRYHSDPIVRRGLLFCLAMATAAVPSVCVEAELLGEATETRAWLEDMMESEPDRECQQLALQCLLIVDGALKKELAVTQ